MKRIKEIVSVMLVAGIVLSAATSCGKEGVDSGDGKNTVRHEESETTHVEENRKEDFSGENILKIIPPFESGHFVTSYDCGDGAYMNLYSGATVNGFSAYTDSLTEKNFEKVFENEKNGNKIATFYTEGFLLNCIYTPYKSKVLLIAEPRDRSPEFFKSKYTGNRLCSPTITQIGMDYIQNPDGEYKYQSGECYVIRLYDGTFMVIDGGYYRVSDAVRIYDCMKEQSPNAENIVISAWLFTHAHTDHIGAFIKFADLYGGTVTLEKIICNFPSDADCAVTGDPVHLGELRVAMTKFRGVEIIKAHPGYLFDIGGVTVEILFTTELYFPNKLGYFNISSMISRISFGKKSFLALGDMAMESNRIVSYMYGKTLKSDIVQVAHHGAKGGSTDFYTLVDPEYAFWPVGSGDYERYRYLSRNMYISTSEKIKKVWVAKGEIIAVDIDKLD